MSLGTIMVPCIAAGRVQTSDACTWIDVQRAEAATQVDEAMLEVPRNPLRWYSLGDLFKAIGRVGFVPLSLHCVKMDLDTKLIAALTTPSAPEAHTTLLLEFKCIPFKALVQLLPPRGSAHGSMRT